MQTAVGLKHSSLKDFLAGFIYDERNDLFGSGRKSTIVERMALEGRDCPLFINEFWTSRQRQANSLHEISYRACFKPQLPKFFIGLLTKPKDVVYDPFSGRGTTALEAALLGRNIIANDINPLSRILVSPRLFIPALADLEKRLYSIPFDHEKKADMDLSMFYHPGTEAEIASLRRYLKERKDGGKEDASDSWIRMVATNRLTGHSTGFFSAYTLPPNQAVSRESQKKINQKRGQQPDYRDTRKIILQKTRSLLKDVDPGMVKTLKEIGEKAVFLCEDARATRQIKADTVGLTVTSPPFLDIVQYAEDNWLRCWFNSLDPVAIAKGITCPKKIEDWDEAMGKVFVELHRITRPGGHVAFEVGEVRGGGIKLEEHVAPLGVKAGFDLEGVMINSQEFTKTANIWGISNNKKGTNTNRIVLFRKA